MGAAADDRERQWRKSGGAGAAVTNVSRTIQALSCVRFQPRGRAYQEFFVIGLLHILRLFHSEAFAE